MTGDSVDFAGGISNVDQANTILAAGRADLCAIARGHLLNPHMALAGIAQYREQHQPFPRQYGPARPPPEK